MTKQELKNGMIVETGEDIKYLYLDEILRGYGGWICLSGYNDDLTFSNRDFPEFDIVKVYKNESISLKNIFRNEFLELIWVRPETQKLSEREIEVLKALDVLGYKYIARNESGNIFAYWSKPVKDGGLWFFNNTVHPDELGTSHLKRYLFSFVDWKDKEPTSIQELLSDIEKGEER